VVTQKENITYELEQYGILEQQYKETEDKFFF
jgi:hypothetical protein